MGTLKTGVEAVCAAAPDGKPDLLSNPQHSVGSQALPAASLITATLSQETGAEFNFLV